MYKDKNIQRLVEELDIVEVISEYVPLKKTGVNYKGLSPFKEEKTPSFTVSPVKNIFKDFSTGIGGDVIAFYMKINNISFMEAVKELAKKYNKNIGNFKNFGNKEQVNGKYYEIMKEAQNYFSNSIFTSDLALKYMENRGYSHEEIKKFGIGFSKDSWDALYIHLENKGYLKEDLIELGLVKENEKGNVYDYFRNRIMFPIYNNDMKIVGFGGRIISSEDKGAKYLNSPDSKIFKKGQELFGLYNRGENIRKKGFAILMEGYLDVLTSQKNGFSSSIASLGTAFTKEQAQLLKRYTENVIIAYDSDSAGKEATVKATIILKKYGFNIRALDLQGDSKDPDEYLKKYGRKGFLEILKKSKDIFDFLFEKFSADVDLESYIGKVKLLNRLKDFIENVNNEIEKAKYLQVLFDKFPDYKKEIEKMFHSNNVKGKKKLKVVQREEKKEYNTILLKTRNTLEKETLIYLLKYGNSSKEEHIKHCDKLKNKNIKKYENLINKLNIINFQFHKLNDIDLVEEERKQFLLRKIDGDLQEETEIEVYRDLFLRWYLLELEEILLKNPYEIELINIRNSLRGRDNLYEFSNLENIEKSYEKFKLEKL